MLCSKQSIVRCPHMPKPPVETMVFGSHGTKNCACALLGQSEAPDRAHVTRAKPPKIIQKPSPIDLTTCPITRRFHCTIGKPGSIWRYIFEHSLLEIYRNIASKNVSRGLRLTDSNSQGICRDKETGSKNISEFSTRDSYQDPTYEGFYQTPEPLRHVFRRII